jgi:hypothetical protein
MHASNEKRGAMSSELLGGLLLQEQGTEETGGNDTARWLPRIIVCLEDPMIVLDVPSEQGYLRPRP